MTKAKSLFFLLITAAAICSASFSGAAAGNSTNLPGDKPAAAVKRKLFFPLVPNRVFPCVPARAVKERARVVEIVDGDDIIVTLNGQRAEVHYIGADTPDSSDKAYEAESTTKNRQLVGGRTVTLVRDGVNRDEYGRLRRYIFAGDTFVNQELIAKGYAWANEAPPDYACADSFQLAQQNAIDFSLGMWAQIAK